MITLNTKACSVVRGTERPARLWQPASRIIYRDRPVAPRNRPCMYVHGEAGGPDACEAGMRWAEAGSWPVAAPKDLVPGPERLTSHVQVGSTCGRRPLRWLYMALFRQLPRVNPGHRAATRREGNRPHKGRAAPCVTAPKGCASWPRGRPPRLEVQLACSSLGSAANAASGQGCEADLPRPKSGLLGVRLTQKLSRWGDTGCGAL